MGLNNAKYNRWTMGEGTKRKTDNLTLDEYIDLPRRIGIESADKSSDFVVISRTGKDDVRSQIRNEAANVITYLLHNLAKRGIGIERMKVGDLVYEIVGGKEVLRGIQIYEKMHDGQPNKVMVEIPESLRGDFIALSRNRAVSYTHLRAHET